MPVLESLGTAVPGEPVPQDAVREKVEQALGELEPSLLRHLSVFDNTGIAQRHFVRPLEWYLETRGWRERMTVFEQEGLALIARAAQDALRAADVPASAVDGIVLVSTTGISTPSLDARLLNRMPFRRDVVRMPLWGLGCAGGVAGLNAAARLAQAEPQKRFLLLSLETCSLAFHPTDLSLRAFVATTLFADGAAAALVRGDDVEGAGLGRLLPGASHAWPDTEDVMGWTVEDEGLNVVFSRRIPDIVEGHLAPIVEEYLKAREGRADRHVIHPGGAKVLDAYGRALRVPPERLDASRDALRDFGNMSSPTVLFALRESLRRHALDEDARVLLAAFGPGFSAELGMLEGLA